MKIINFVENTLCVNLSAYQKELLILLEGSPRGYLKDVLHKNPTPLIKQVVTVYEKYEHELASV